MREKQKMKPERISGARADAIAFGSGLTAVGEDGLLEGYLVPFTSADEKDLHGEYFTAETDLGLDEPGWGIEGKPVLWNHGNDPLLETTGIGVFVKSRKDELGIWVQAQIDMANAYAKGVYQLVKAGLLKVGWSSGAHRKSVKVDKATGFIGRWRIVEGSMTPAPAKPFSTGIIASKSLDDAGLSLERLLKEAREDTPERSLDGDAGLHVLGQGQAGNTGGSQIIMNKVTGLAARLASEKGLEFTGVELAAMAADVSGVLAADAALIEGATAEAVKSDAGVIGALDRVAALLAERMQTALALREAGLFAEVNVDKAFGLPGAQVVPGSARTLAGGAQHDAGPQRSNTLNAPQNIAHLRLKSALGRLSPEALSFAIHMDEQAQHIPGARGMRWAHDAGAQQAGRNVAKSVFAAHALEMADQGDFEFDGPDQYEKAVVLKELGAKANEIMGSTMTGFGDEWVSEGWSGMIWPRVRRENVVAGRLNPFEMKHAIENWPTDGSDGDALYIDERVNITEFNAPADNTAKIGTAKVQFDTSDRKLQRQVPYAAELFEDSIIKADTQFEMQARRSVMDAVDYVCLLGDDETGTTNMNYDGAAAPAKSRWLMFDGIAHYALNNTGHDVGGGAPILQDLVTALYLMDDEIVGQDNDDVVFFTHSAVFGRLLTLGEYTTHDKLGRDGSAVTGQVRKIAGAEVLVTAQMPKSAANGKISTTAANNTFGRGVFVHRPSWKLGYKRKVGSYLSRALDGESYLLTVTARFDLKQHSNGGGSSMAYHIAVA
jgi:hypothetical protein